jgi:hypothetical protein
LILDLGPEFVHDATANLQPIPDSLVGLALAVDNDLFGNVCPYSVGSLQGGIACANCNAEFGTSNQQILIILQDAVGLMGQRAAEVGVKLARIHPIINTSSGLYRNAKGGMLCAVRCVLCVGCRLSWGYLHRTDLDDFYYSHCD